jgi:hypothetical protein
MKIKTALLVLSLTSIGFSQSKDSISLWKSAYYGMNLDQVRQSFPEAKITDLSVIAQSKEKDLVEMLRIDNFSVLSENFTIRFLFDGKKQIQNSGLCQVQFVLNRSDLSYDEGIALLRRASEALTTKYGRSISYNEDGEKVVAGILPSGKASGTWSNGKTSIIADFNTIFVSAQFSQNGNSGYRSSFSMTYGAGLSQESEKL